LFSDFFPEYIPPSTDLKLLEILLVILTFIPKEIIEIIVTYGLNYNNYEHILNWIKIKFQSVFPSDRKLWMFVINALVACEVKEVFEFIYQLNVENAPRLDIA